jgi:predicted transcriptional regulator of viral defense system
VIVPPEYRSLGCLPADQFIPDLMTLLNLPYYAGLLTAAQYHGAAHHRPQEFQVLLGKRHRPIVCGAVRVAFMMRKRIAEVPVQPFNTLRGSLLVSSVEATAIDLIGYERRVGGLNQLITVLSELARKIDPQKLLAATRTAPLPWAQRLGYLLELVGATDRAVALRSHVRKRVKQPASLVPSLPRNQTQLDKNWQLYVNADLEPEL